MYLGSFLADTYIRLLWYSIRPYILAVDHTPALCVYHAPLKCTWCSGNLCPLLWFDLCFPSPESVLWKTHYLDASSFWKNMVSRVTFILTKQTQVFIRMACCWCFQTSHCGFQWASTGVQVTSLLARFLRPCHDSSNTNENWCSPSWWLKH